MANQIFCFCFEIRGERLQVTTRRVTWCSKYKSHDHSHIPGCIDLWVGERPPPHRHIRQLPPTASETTNHERKIVCKKSMRKCAANGQQWNSIGNYSKTSMEKESMEISIRLYKKSENRVKNSEKNMTNSEKNAWEFWENCMKNSRRMHEKSREYVWKFLRRIVCRNDTGRIWW